MYIIILNKKIFQTNSGTTTPFFTRKCAILPEIGLLSPSAQDLTNSLI
jgi:hypothetical protein